MSTNKTGFGMTLGEVSAKPNKKRSPGGLTTEQKLRFDDEFRRDVAQLQGAPTGIENRANYRIGIPSPQWADTVRALLCEEKEDNKKPGKMFVKRIWMHNYRNEPRLALGTVRCQETLANGERCEGSVVLEGWMDLVNIHQSPQASMCPSCKAKDAKHQQSMGELDLRIREALKGVDERRASAQRAEAEKQVSWVVERLRSQFDEKLAEVNSEARVDRAMELIEEAKVLQAELDCISKSGITPEHVALYEAAHSAPTEAEAVVSEVVSEAAEELAIEDQIAQLDAEIAAKS